MLNKLYRGWVDLILRGDASFVLPIGIVAVVVFFPTLLILLAEWRFKTFDMFPGAELLLPWAIGLTLIVLALGVGLLFCGLRNVAYPGSLLYRLTHSMPRRPS